LKFVFAIYSVGYSITEILHEYPEFEIVV